MRHLTVIAFILLLSSLLRLSSQPCSWLTFTTQSQIDSFPINYPGCTDIGGYLRIIGGNITNLDGLLGVTSVQAEIKIEYTNISNLSGLDSLKTVGLYFNMWQNHSLTTLTGLDNLSFVYQGIQINGCDALVGLTGLGGVDWSTSGSLIIASCPSLKNLIGLESLEDVIRGIEIRNNDSLTSLDGLESLGWIWGSINIRGNAQLNSLSSLNNLDSIAGELYIYDNDSLVDLEGLSNLSHVDGHLIIENNDALVDLSGLSNLKYIFWILHIIDNDALISLNGIDSINAEMIYEMYISENSSLSTCHIYSVCDFLVNGYGNAIIKNNAEGCNNQLQVADSCGIISVQEIVTNGTVSTYPNPFTTFTTIEYELKEISNIQFTIYNVIGEVVYATEDRLMPQGSHTVTWSPGHLPEGMYYAVLRSEDGVLVVKMVKQ